MMSRIKSHIFPAIAAAIALYVAVEWREPHPVAEFNRISWPESARAGDSIYIKSHVIRSKDGCASIITRRWVNEINTDIVPPQTVRVAELPKGLEVFEATLRVPDTATPGFVLLRTRAEFRCNAVQKLFGGSVLPLQDIKIRIIE